MFFLPILCRMLVFGWVRHQGGGYEPGRMRGAARVGWPPASDWLRPHSSIQPLSPSLSSSLAFVWPTRWAHEFPWPPHAHPRAADGEACRRGGHTLLRPGARLSVRLALSFPWHIRGLVDAVDSGLRLFGTSRIFLMLKNKRTCRIFLIF